MAKNVSIAELDDIHSKYERLQSMIGILHMFTAETMGSTGIPSGSLANALFEIELGMGEANDRLKSIFAQEGSAV